MILVEDDDVVRAFSADATDDSFHIAVLPRRTAGCHHLFDAERTDAPSEIVTIDAIPVADQIARRGIPWEGFKLITLIFTSGEKFRLRITRKLLGVKKHEENVDYICSVLKARSAG